MKYLNIIKFIFLINIISCTNIKKFNDPNIEGIYIRSGFKSEKIIFHNGFFAIIDNYHYNIVDYVCCDTITYGKWSYINKNNIISLRSDDYLTDIVSIKINEKKILNKDSLYFSLVNPIEKSYKDQEANFRDIGYSLEFELENSKNFKEEEIVFYSNLIKIYNPKHYKIKKFNLFIYPKLPFSGRNVGVKQVSSYENLIINPESNFFEINIPKLTYPFLTYLRLNKEFVRVINKDTLEWRGNIYVKQKK